MRQRVSTALPRTSLDRRAASADAPIDSYLGHTPRLLRLKYLGDQPRRRGTNPGGKSPSCVSHRLRRTTDVAIPSYREGSPWHVRPFRAVTVSRSSCCGFRGIERGSVPLPAHGNLSLLGSVFRSTHRQALAGLSWLSSSRPPHLTTVPGLVGPVRPVARREAPHAGQVARSPRGLLSPLDGIKRRARCERVASPALCDGGLKQQAVSGMSASPPLVRGANYRIG
jgi:hypothetical protein